MKHLFKIFSLLVMLTLISCDKEEQLENNLEGSWELRHVLGVQIAGASPDHLPGNGHIIKFEGNNYQALSKGAVVSSGTFLLIKDETEIDGAKYSFKIDFDQKLDLDMYVKVSGRTLKTSVGSITHDGFTLTYAKL